MESGRHVLRKSLYFWLQIVLVAGRRDAGTYRSSTYVSAPSTQLVPLLALSPEGSYSLPESGEPTSAKDVAASERRDLKREVAAEVSFCGAKNDRFQRDVEDYVAEITKSSGKSMQELVGREGQEFQPPHGRKRLRFSHWAEKIV